MIRADIFGGLKLALTKGETLKQAMISFYNAGYNKAEIEEAAKAVKQGFQTVMPQQPEKVAPTPKTSPALIKPVQRVSSYGKPTHMPDRSYHKIKKGISTAIKELERIEMPKKVVVQKPVQQVSGYSQNVAQTKDKVVFGLLIFALIVLLGAVASVFIFRAEIISFLDGLFV